MKSIVLSALTAFANPTPVLAQNISTNLVVELTFDKTIIDIGETSVGSITAFWNGVPGSYFSSINVDLFPSGQFVEINSINPVVWNNPSLGFSGQATFSGANIFGLESTQFGLFPPVLENNPIHITSFTLTGVAPGVLVYTAEMTSGFATFPFSVTGPFFSDPTVAFGEEVFTSQPITVIPSPGAVAMLTLSGVLMSARRFRKTR